MFSIGVIGMALFAASDASIAWLTTKFLEGAFVKPIRGSWSSCRSALFVLFLVRGIGDYVSNYFPGWVGRQVIKALRGELFSHYLHLPSLYFDGQQSGQMLSRLTYNIELVAEASTNAITVIIRDTLTIVGLVGFLLYLNWRLALFTFIAAPLISWLIQVANRAFRRYSARIQNSMGEVTRVAKEAIDGQRLIKVFNAQDFEARKFEQDERAASPQQHAPDHGEVDQQPRSAADRRRGTRRCHVRRDPAGARAPRCASINSSAFSPRCCCSPRRCAAWSA